MVVGGNTFDDYFANLTAYLGGDVALAEATVRETAKLVVPPTVGGDDAQAVANVQAAFPQAAPVQQYAAPAQPAAPTFVTQRQAPAGPPPGQQPPLCDHGYAREFKSGTGKNPPHKVWKAWMCPMPKGESCEPQWIR